ncbi:MAG TPA: DNA alkylation repair protein [Steroidobacteraceae bacterium]|nr:DNA alkylation repair protein [Steroidobacteraceae bacterium]
MADTLKSQFGPAVPRELARMIRAVHAEFPHEDFVRDVLKGYGPLSLTGRGWHIAAALQRHLPADYPRAVEILVASSTQPRAAAAGGMDSFLYIPHLFFVSKHGLAHFEESMRAQHALTQLFTAEFSIRAFLETHPQRTLARLREWTKDPSPHVRRLVSEGTRPRLPWAPRLRAFQQDPAPVIELLELLKDDPELYVRRSVANNLNDIGKDHPEVVAGLARRWLREATPERQWIVRHALRSAIKRADAGALRALGYGGKASVAIRDVQIAPAKAAIGGDVTISFTVKSTGAKRQRVMVDLVVHFVKSRGTGAKTFKLKAVELAPGESVGVRKKISLKQHTTRKHYVGKHVVEVLLNGARRRMGTFLVS